MANHKKTPLFFEALKTSLPFLTLLFLFSLFWYGWQRLNDPNFLPIHHVSISANAQHIPTKKLKKIVSQNIEGGFFSLQTDRLQNALLSLPWVSSLAIQRGWPDQLKIMIHERQPLARWGKSGVVDKKGQVFFPVQSSIPQSAPTLFGPIDRLPDVLSLYKALVPLTQSVLLHVRSLTLDARGSWQVRLSNGLLVILGREDMLLRYKRFVSLYPKIIGKNSSKAQTIDLRYPNGLAIKWKGHAPAVVTK